MTERRVSLLRYRLQQAEEALKAARILLDSSIHRTSASQSYYAMFYAVLALLLGTDRRTSKHSGAIACFDLDFIRDGELPKHLSTWLHDAFELRLEADYREFSKVSERAAQETLRRAREFVEAVRTYVGKWTDSPEADEA